MKVLILIASAAFIISSCGPKNAIQQTDNQENNSVTGDITEELISLDEKNVKIDSLNAELDLLLKEIETDF